ncbi:hypothetical protein GCM10023183_22630 [Nibribacter koreensis]|uniref:Uncharacterized protein n=1 Tax=Nibribacter koreensis TaxID=1084519 RepID=A0ABP8FMK3_9BACT
MALLSKGLGLPELKSSAALFPKYQYVPCPWAKALLGTQQSRQKKAKTPPTSNLERTDERTKKGLDRIGEANLRKPKGN